jgi:hypothetical protein
VNKQTKIALITFSVFMAEAIVHYNFGSHKHTEDKKFKLPPTNDLIKIGGVVAVFSLINGYVIKKIVNGK